MTHDWTRRQMLRGLAGGAGSLALHSCTNRQAQSPNKALTVGVVAWPGYAGHYVAMAKKLFEAEGVEVAEAFRMGPSRCSEPQMA